VVGLQCVLLEHALVMLQMCVCCSVCCSGVCSGVLQWCGAVVGCSGAAAMRVTGTHTGDDTHTCV